jgi:starch phosphorylase
MDLYRNNPRLNRILNTLIDGTWKEGSYFYNIFNEIMTKNDEFFILYDFESYREAQLKIQELYSDKTKWNTMCLMNVAKSGYFSSDRTIEEYVRDIWDLKKIVNK